MLSARTADSDDLVCRTLTSLAGTVQQPDSVWESLQAANALSHDRWAELCMRTMHAATLCGAKVPYAEWCKTLVSVISNAAVIPTLQFRKLGVEHQMMLVADMELSGNEVDEVILALTSHLYPCYLQNLTERLTEHCLVHKVIQKTDCSYNCKQL